MVIFNVLTFKYGHSDIKAGEVILLKLLFKLKKTMRYEIVLIGLFLVIPDDH